MGTHDLDRSEKRPDCLEVPTAIAKYYYHVLCIGSEQLMLKNINIFLR